MKEPVVMSWSGGKDSAVALYEILQQDDVEVLALVTTVTEAYDCISMHGVRRALLEKQAKLIGIPLETVLISRGASNDEYESRLLDVVRPYRERGVRRLVFGDLFLEDIRHYRDRILTAAGMSGIYPIWQRDTQRLAQEVLALGIRAITTCVDPRVLSASFVGRMFDADFLRSLPAGVDPCGENGEFHTFVFGGPIFEQEVKFTAGKVFERDSFLYCDLLPS